MKGAGVPTIPGKFRLNAASTHEQRRENSHRRGYTPQWYRMTKLFRADHPFCVECEKAGYSVAATVVDHITPHRGNQELFWDRKNWQCLCKTCHDLKTARGL